MIAKVKYHNPITNDESVLTISYPKFVDYSYWITKNVQTQDDVFDKLNQIIKDMDCTREYSCGRPMMTSYLNYLSLIEDFVYYLMKIDNQFIYNKYIDKLISRHIDNILFEHNNPVIVKSKGKTKKVSKPKVENKFLRRETKDLFTGETIYFYENLKTGESIESKNPNLLDELNNKPKKVKKEPKTKSNAVSLSAMTFSFAKKL